jgi:hypothetical protein
VLYISNDNVRVDADILMQDPVAAAEMKKRRAFRSTSLPFHRHRFELIALYRR